MKTEQTECSETLAYKIQTPGNYPEESIQHSEHGESLKSGIFQASMFDRLACIMRWWLQVPTRSPADLYCGWRARSHVMGTRTTVLSSTLIARVL